jgi:DNA-binding winged helix-turn-helix (wHTH) protein/tetratricopeptide (TPR) repeat protein/TolB-like protein
MSPPVKSRRLYRFGLFESDPTKGELTRQGSRIRLQDQPFRLLTVLLEHPGEVVSREELRQKLWPADTFVEFDGSLNAALKRLRAALSDSAENPVFIETVPKRGYRFIAPVAVKEKSSELLVEEPGVTAAVPLHPQPSPTEPEVTALEQVSAEARLEAVPVRGKAFTYAATAIVIIVSAVLTALGWSSYRHRPQTTVQFSPSVADPIPVRKSVAVLGFHNASGRPQDDWMATAFVEMLSTELATGEKLRLVSGEEVTNLRISSPWSQTSTLGRETTARIGTALNSDVLVLGSYTAIGKPDRGQLRLDVILQDARSGGILSQIAQTSASDDLFRVTSEIGTRLRERLGVSGVSDSEQAGVLASLPLNREAAKFYALGIARLREFDALAAKDLLEQASRADPKFSLAHALLARAWGQLGYEQKRKEEAKKALDLSIDLPRVDRMQVEGDYYESLPDHEKAASTYRALFELFPDSVEYGLLLTWAQINAGHMSQAMDTVARLRHFAPPASDDPRIDLAEVRAIVPNRPAALILVRSAMQKSTAQGKKLIYAGAREEECMNLIYGDQLDEGALACEDAYKIFLAAGNRLGAADCIRLLGDREGAEGHLERAIATYERALKLLNRTGENAKTGRVLNNMAIDYTNEGKLDRGEQLYRQAKFHFEQTGDQHNTATALGNIADIIYLRGNLSQAEKLYRQALEIDASLDQHEPGYLLYRLADLKLTQGEVKEARRLAQQAIDTLPEQAGAASRTEALLELAGVLQAEGDLAGSRQQLEQVLAVRQKIGEMGAIEEAQAEAADLALAEGRPAEAESLLRPAITEFENEKSDPAAASAYVELSQALLEQGKLDEARQTVQRAAALTRTNFDPASKLPVAIQIARVETAEGAKSARPASFAAVVRRLRWVIASAKRSGYYQIECEARLALAEAEKNIDPALSASQSETLAEEAHEHGLEFLSHQARQLAMTAPPSMSASSSPTP